jgi:hypothetical protein
MITSGGLCLLGRLAQKRSDMFPKKRIIESWSRASVRHHQRPNLRAAVRSKFQFKDRVWVRFIQNPQYCDYCGPLSERFGAFAGHD